MAGFLADLSNGSGAGAGASGSAQGLPGLSPEACRLAWSAPAVDSIASLLLGLAVKAILRMTVTPIKLTIQYKQNDLDFQSNEERIRCKNVLENT